MVIADRTNKIDTNSNASRAFTIATTAKAFSILSDKLYTDKITAVVRELVCNAIDSNKAAGQTDPVQVTFPDYQSRVFRVKDTGLGLSEEDIYRLYTTYFSSSKTDTNDLIGGLGLGSKSPFAYTDKFTIISIFNGTKKTYIAALGAEGFPTINLMSSVSSSEHNGLEVVVAVNDDNSIRQFQDKGRNTLFWMNGVSSNLAGKETFDSVTDETFDKTWSITNEFYFRFTDRRHSHDNRFDKARFWVKMGPVAYPIEQEFERNLVEMFGYNSLAVFEMPIGSLNVSPSRESLSYDGFTKNNLTNAIRSIQQKFADKIVQVIENEKGYPYKKYNAIYRILNNIKVNSFSFKNASDEVQEFINRFSKNYSDDTADLLKNEISHTVYYGTMSWSKEYLYSEDTHKIDFRSSLKIVKLVDNSRVKNPPIKRLMREYLKDHNSTQMLIFKNEPSEDQLISLGIQRNQVADFVIPYSDRVISAGTDDKDHDKTFINAITGKQVDFSSKLPMVYTPRLTQSTRLESLWWKAARELAEAGKIILLAELHMPQIRNLPKNIKFIEYDNQQEMLKLIQESFDEEFKKYTSYRDYTEFSRSGKNAFFARFFGFDWKAYKVDTNNNYGYHSCYSLAYRADLIKKSDLMTAWDKFENDDRLNFLMKNVSTYGFSEKDEVILSKILEAMGYTKDKN